MANRLVFHNLGRASTTLAAGPATIDSTKLVAFLAKPAVDAGFVFPDLSFDVVDRAIDRRAHVASVFLAPQKQSVHLYCDVDTVDAALDSHGNLSLHDAALEYFCILATFFSAYARRASVTATLRPTTVISIHISPFRTN